MIASLAELKSARRTQLFSLVLALSASACASDGDLAASPTLLGDVEQPATAAEPVELSAPRIVTTHEGGLLVLDGSTLAVVSDMKVDGFLRLNPAGDHRHLVISTADAFRFLDTGVSIEDHGDHKHYYGEPPKLTNISVASQKPGHVTHNAGLTALFSDGSGQVELFDPTTLLSGAPRFTSYTAAAPHHGVAVALAIPNGGLLVTVGTATARSGAVALDAARQPLASADNCPGVHGETVAQAGAIVLGCQNGALVYRDSAFHKVESPDATGRIGTAVGSSVSPFVLTDYKAQVDGKLEVPQRVALIDTQKDAIRLVDIGASYTFRSLARGPDGEALVLGTDGALHVIDPQAGEVVDSIEVVQPWTEPTDWQEPRPTLYVSGARAYVTEPATSQVHVVHLGRGTVVRSVELPYVPNELNGIGH